MDKKSARECIRFASPEHENNARKMLANVPADTWAAFSRRLHDDAKTIMRVEAVSGAGPNQDHRAVEESGERGTGTTISEEVCILCSCGWYLEATGWVPGPTDTAVVNAFLDHVLSATKS